MVGVDDSVAIHGVFVVDSVFGREIRCRRRSSIHEHTISVELLDPKVPQARITEKVLAEKIQIVKRIWEVRVVQEMLSRPQCRVARKLDEVRRRVDDRLRGSDHVEIE